MSIRGSANKESWNYLLHHIFLIEYLCFHKSKYFFNKKLEFTIQIYNIKLALFGCTFTKFGKIPYSHGNIAVTS